MRDSLPPSITIRSDDMPDPILPAFFRHVPVEAVIDSRSWGADNPEALRERGPRAVGEALTRLALAGQGSVFQDVREVSALILDYLTTGLHDDPLDLDLGLRRRDGRPDLALISRRAERDRLVLDLARRGPWAAMGPWQAAKAIRAAFADYEANRLAGDRKRGRRPSGDDATFWLISRLALPQGGLPKERDLAALIAEGR